MAGVEGCEEKRRRRNEQVLSFHNTILHLTQQRVCDCPIVLAPLLTTHPSSTPHCSSKTFSTPLFTFFCPFTPFSSTHLYSPPIFTHHPSSLTTHPHSPTHPPSLTTHTHSPTDPPSSTEVSQDYRLHQTSQRGVIPPAAVLLTPQGAWAKEGAMNWELCLVVMSCAVL